jgi:hypothetical protein
MKRRNVRFWHFADKPTAPGFVAYWTNNGQRWISARVGCDAIDPQATLAVHCDIGFDAAGRPYAAPVKAEAPPPYSRFSSL